MSNAIRVGRRILARLRGDRRGTPAEGYSTRWQHRLPFVECLWRSVKYEEVYLNAYESMTEAKTGIGNWIEYYNHARKHQTLGTTPELMYADSADLRKAA